LDLGQGLQERIIIDPQLFCTTVMGQLSEPEALRDRSAPHGIGSDGMITRADFVERLQLDKIDRESAQLALQVLENHLWLCSKAEGGDRFIVPVLLRTLSGQREGACFDAPHEAWNVVCGRRFECEGDIDALSPGFFPKLQAVLPQDQACSSVRYSQGGLWAIIDSSEVLLHVSPALTSEFCEWDCVFGSPD
jgi:hypothetical protein